MPLSFEKIPCEQVALSTISENGGLLETLWLNKKLLGTSASLLVTSALLVVTMFAINVI